MLPPFNDEGNLPLGIHNATWEELEERFGTNSHRETLLRGMKKALLALKAAGCQRVYIDGSFVTDKSDPHDYDACWEMDGVDPDLLDPFLLEFDNTLFQKAKYRGELFPVDSRDTEAKWSFLVHFQTDKETNHPKGIVALDLGRLDI